MKLLKKMMTCKVALSLLLFLLISPTVSFASLQCYHCHGTKGQIAGTGDIRPEDASYRNPSSGGFVGSHRAHVSLGATSESCEKCHPGSRNYSSAHRNGMIKVSARINLSPLDATYKNSTSAWPQTATPLPGGCTNVNCHFEKDTLNWGDSPTLLSCSSCHTSPPSSGSHGKKHGDYFGNDTTSCSKCHPNHLAAGSNVFSHASGAGKRGITVQFTTAPNSGGAYSGGSTNYPDYLQLSSPRNGVCTDLYCHSDGRGGAAVKTPPITWSDSRTTDCYSCHRGRTTDSTPANCDGFGVWSSSKEYCTPDLTMSSNGHHRLVGPQWIRKYPCYYCHNATVDSTGNLSDITKHVDGVKNVSIHPDWNIDNRPAASYDAVGKVCNNIYCHSDGTTDPEDVRPFAWTEPKTDCNSCHGHPVNSCSNTGCHDGRTDTSGKFWPVKTGWPVGSEWMGAMPMFPNGGPGNPRANSHPRHAQTNFTCDTCHNKTIKGDCASCHAGGIPPGGMGEVAHLDPFYHVNTKKDVDFKGMPSAVYDKNTKTCSATTCHPVGDDPVWGGSVNNAQTCLYCHGIAGSESGSNDVDDFNAFNGTQGKIDKKEWVTTGHGRMSSAANSGSYQKSGNPAAQFPGNPCWYCHDNSVLHKDGNNPFRLKMHNQYKQRFEKECVYCHMEGTNTECFSCHVGQTESLSPQATGSGILYKFKNTSTEIRFPTHVYLTGCISASCHDSDSSRHKVNAGVWTTEQKNDVKNQYLQMGVCLQCHDDDSSNQCTSCHLAPENNPMKYSLGFDPGTGFIKPKKARASAGHFGYKHYRAFKDSGGWLKHYTSVRSPNFGTYSVANGTWKGGKFCWDCHDPHGDSNIFMIQKKVATETDGWFGVPKPGKRKDVVFTGIGGTDYARKSGAGVVFDGICNVCHSPDSKHYTNSSGDGHNSTRRCTSCHEHRFADSHANKQSCDSCHESSKPIPKHTAFGLPRDCTKCHSGTVGRRMDVMGQMKANSHHVQGIEVSNKHCYRCHWEATAEGLIDVQHHTGYNYKNYSSVKNDPVDLVIFGKGVRPIAYRNVSTADGRATAISFLASNMGTSEERAEVGKISNHCLSCHSDQNNDSDPFGDFKTPRQYAWDLQSVASRYLQLGTATWGKYGSTSNAAQKNITKSFSAHGNAVANGGGWDPVTGLDGVIMDTRGGVNNKNVQCFDCHNSHGSKVVGTTSSYTTFNGTNNGANLKETKKDMGGYTADYKASANSSGVNPYGAGAGQCFDCHNSASAGTVVPNGKTPWGYDSTFGASAPILGYKDTPRFATPTQPSEIKASTARFSERDIMQTIVGGHLKASMPGTSLANLAKYAGSADSGSSATILVDGAATGWATPANKWQNFYLLMGSGSNSGQLRRITGNTSNTLTVEAFNADMVEGDTYKIVPYSATVNSLCSSCHDPHGVSPTMGISNQAYAVPLLKGTWMTSPYKEDAPPPVPSGDHTSLPYAGAGNYNGKPLAWGRFVTTNWNENHPIPTQPVIKVNLDRSTFGGSMRISEQDDKFAGLCLNCHNKANLTDGVNRNDGAAGFKTVDRVHEAVKGWGVNSEHSFTCSKCHQPHNSGLPRLMQTNCLDYKHRGGLVSGGQPWVADKTKPSNAHAQGGEHRGYPIGSMTPYNYSVGNGRTWSNIFEATTACHVGRFNPTYNSSTPPTQWPDGNLWNNVTPW